MTDLTPNDLSHLSDEEFTALAPQGYHATGPAETLSPAPPPELVQQWDDEGTEMFRCRFRPEYQMHIATRAAQWGANQELEACCEWLDYKCPSLVRHLRSDRCPKPPSLKEQALTALLHLDHGQHNERYLIIRRALESIND